MAKLWAIVGSSQAAFSNLYCKSHQVYKSNYEDSNDVKLNEYQLERLEIVILVFIICIVFNCGSVVRVANLKLTDLSLKPPR